MKNLLSISNEQANDDFEICTTHKVVSERDLDKRLADILWTMGISANLHGHFFLKEAVKLSMSNPKYIASVTRVMYPEVALKFQTTACRVERAIRHSIDASHRKGKLIHLNDLLGLEIFDALNKPSNAELIALLADKLALEFC